ncbi:TPA: hypothetical protein N0F65_001361 [Lagenidium giganteum]|uniref:Amino acid transporter n=1 Tax=Lagenidium giganteum TaxID=4803 RepID=A0AAV2Z0L1_9STRA|nr:TPA: hypothetical protein N0F65_001361 [Lagenidium giganteum]
MTQRNKAPSIESSQLTELTPTTHFLEQPVIVDVKKIKLPTVNGGTAAPMDSDDGTIINLVYLVPNIMTTLAFSIFGFIIGAVCNKWPLSDALASWIGLFGRLYQNVMECLALPLIFTSVAICIAQLELSQKTKDVMTRTLVFFFAMSLVSTVVATFIAMAFASAFDQRVAPLAKDAPAMLQLQCPNGKYLGMDGTCSESQLSRSMVFKATNITGITLKTAPAKTISYASQISAFFQTLFPSNITDAIANQQLLGVIVFSMLLGAGVVLSHDKTNNASGENHALMLLKQISVVLELVLNWMLKWTPLATFSAMSYSVMKGTITQEQLRMALYLPVVLGVTLLAVFLVVGCGGYFIFVRKNPFKFLWYLTPGLLFLFATGSYPASIPVLMRSVEGSRQVSRTLANFTLSIGVSLSLCGTASFFIIGCYFMAYTSGQSDLLTGGRTLLLIIVSTLSSFGTPHLSGAALGYMSTIWITVFSVPVPGCYIFLVWMEWVNTRMRRVVNVIIVAFISRIIADQLDETAEDEEERRVGVQNVYHPMHRSHDSEVLHI